MGTRSKELIVNFIDGFTDGWKYAVPESFRDALDIKKGQITNKQTPVWTQGERFNFKEGDTLYTSKEAYEGWNNPWDKSEAILQVQAAQAAKGLSNNEQDQDDGWVRFWIKYKFTEHKIEMTCTQREFVEGLRTGLFTSTSIPTINESEPLTKGTANE